jgi:hypothetical protein
MALPEPIATTVELLPEKTDFFSLVLQGAGFIGIACTLIGLLLERHASNRRVSRHRWAEWGTIAGAGAGAGLFLALLALQELH